MLLRLKLTLYYGKQVWDVSILDVDVQIEGDVHFFYTYTPGSKAAGVGRR